MVEKLRAFDSLIYWSFKSNVYIKIFTFTQLAQNILYDALEVTMLSFIWNNPPSLFLLQPCELIYFYLHAHEYEQVKLYFFPFLSPQNISWPASINNMNNSHQ